MLPNVSNSSPLGKSIGRIDFCIWLATSNSRCSETSLSREESAAFQALMFSSVRSIVTWRSSKSSGLVTKSNAPRFIAVRMFFMSPYAETITARRSGFNSAIWDSSVSPSILGMLMSETTMSMSGSPFSTSSASIPFWAKTNEYRPDRM